MVVLELAVEIGIGRMQLSRSVAVAVGSGGERELEAIEVATYRGMNHAVHRHRAGHGRDDNQPDPRPEAESAHSRATWPPGVGSDPSDLGVCRPRSWQPDTRFADPVA